MNRPGGSLEAGWHRFLCECVCCDVFLRASQTPLPFALFVPADAPRATSQIQAPRLRGSLRGFRVSDRSLPTSRSTSPVGSVSWKGAVHDRVAAEACVLCEQRRAGSASCLPTATFGLVMLHNEQGWAYVARIDADSAADRSKVEVLDELLSVEELDSGTSVSVSQNMSLSELAQLLQGPLGSEAMLSFRRPGGQTKEETAAEKAPGARLDASKDEEGFYAVKMRRTCVQSVSGLAPLVLRYVYVDGARFENEIQHGGALRQADTVAVISTCLRRSLAINLHVRELSRCAFFAWRWVATACRQAAARRAQFCTQHFVRRSSRALLCCIFAHAREHTACKHRQQRFGMRVQRIVAGTRKRYVMEAWMGLSAQREQEERATARRADIHARLQSKSNKMRVRRAVVGWKQIKHEKQVFSRKAVKFISNLTTASAAAGLRSWQNFLRLVQQQRRVCRKIVLRMLAGIVERHFCKWMSRAKEVAKARNRTHRVIQRWRYQVLAQALGCWSEQHAQNSRLLKLSTRVIQRWIRGVLSMAWLRWCETILSSCVFLRAFGHACKRADPILASTSTHKLRQVYACAC